MQPLEANIIRQAQPELLSVNAPLISCPDINVRAEYAEDPYGVSNEPVRAFSNLSAGIYPSASKPKSLSFTHMRHSLTYLVGCPH
jgi:hypothetical protein